MLTAEQYRDQLMALAPRGAALPTDLDSVWCLLLLAMATELARADRRADDVLDELDPRTALELLSDWERVCGLPGQCSQASETIQERREALLLVLTAQGGQSVAYYEEIAAALGVAAVVEEFHPFLAGSDTGDPLTNDGWTHAWRMRGPDATVRYFEAGGAAAGEPLADWGNEAFECNMLRLAPAHTLLTFAYGDE
ncbi:YmfQ family protein [Pseudodesulfovibrio indicus]|uniref:Uncharacterized protein YmfQ (DUF2313 family) n=1 Tax=Pseudodesulfovibrio indicus TaxID=1716143 RepID=A0A140D8Z2_9BACT|nr:putative phage tail protein [Pseudodesulfovibrio indicus]AMK09659.1 hypothetical protein AWY79_00315 [Pseudodesulfovibrio indicus]TDT86389.1 uncharacterized protein YmfQ (DUF2313 family) [Pseudodesulfovibrio indicus]